MVLDGCLKHYAAKRLAKKRRRMRQVLEICEISLEHCYSILQISLNLFYSLSRVQPVQSILYKYLFTLQPMIHDPLRVLYRAGCWLALALLPGSAGWVAMSGEWRRTRLAFEVARPAASGLRPLRIVCRVDRRPIIIVERSTVVRSDAMLYYGIDYRTYNHQNVVRWLRVGQ
jgi:hypothetical protein